MTRALPICSKDQKRVLGFPHTVRQSGTCQSNRAQDGEDWQAPVGTFTSPFNHPLEGWSRLSGVSIREAVKSITLSPRITTAGKTGIVATYLNLLICLKMTEEDLSKRLMWHCQSLPERISVIRPSTLCIKKSCALCCSLSFVTSNHPFVSLGNNSHLDFTVIKWG